MKYLIEKGTSDPDSYTYEEKHNEEGTIHELRYSSFSPLYTKYKESLVAAIKDHGDGVILKIGKKSLKLDYSDIFHLGLLLDQYLGKDKDVLILREDICPIIEFKEDKWNLKREIK